MRRVGIPRSGPQFGRSTWARRRRTSLRCAPWPLAEPLATAPVPQARFAVAGRHVPALLAALHEVGERAPSPTWGAPTWAATGGSPWRVSPTADSGLRLTGPAPAVQVIEGAADDLPVRSIEIDYRDLWSLRVSCGDRP